MKPTDPGAILFISESLPIRLAARQMLRLCLGQEAVLDASKPANEPPAVSYRKTAENHAHLIYWPVPWCGIGTILRLEALWRKAGWNGGLLVAAPGMKVGGELVAARNGLLGLEEDGEQTTIVLSQPLLLFKLMGGIEEVKHLSWDMYRKRSSLSRTVAALHELINVFASRKTKPDGKLQETLEKELADGGFRGMVPHPREKELDKTVANLASVLPQGDWKRARLLALGLLTILEDATVSA